MTDLLPITRLEMLAEVERELRLRRFVYPKRIAAHQLSRERAERQIEVMQAVATWLAREIKDGPADP